MSPGRDASPQRLRLAASLRRLRHAAGLSGEELASRLGISQSKLSRLELGDSVPQVTDVSRWGEATGAPHETITELITLAEEVATEATLWRRSLRRGLGRLQRDVQAVETSAMTISNFSPVVLPGLLQTPEYARRLALLAFPEGRPDIAEGVAARMARQSVVYDESKRLTFVIAEPVLRWRLGPPPIMRAQLDRILGVSDLPNVQVGILTQDRELTTWYSHGFNLFEDRIDDQDPVVHASTLTTGVTVTDPADVDRYRQVFTRLREAAVFGDQARALLRGA